jgi:hypothetical protein
LTKKGKCGKHIIEPKELIRMVGNMSKIDRKRIDEIVKDFRKSVMPSKKTMVMFMLIAVVIFLPLLFVA